ncbi:MAG TPA: bifunctional UDP-sugar hydrolase/5'-nucleotidase [Anaerolineaceae bacterium]|nr:bifunctional UDP-sugar hydrolase/5'-nucleotidase [Anaerolineaceae bacterium]
MATEKVILDFIGHTDFAAAIRPSYHCPGAARLKAYFDFFRAQNPQGTLVLDAGDILCGGPIINLTHGEPVVEIVNHFGYDAMTLGNHEFDYGRAIMRRTLSRAAFPLLCANILEKDTGQLLDFVRPYLLVEKQGVRIGILGVTTAYTPYMVKKESFDPFEILDPVAVCNQYIPQMRAEGAELIVVLGHLPGAVSADGQRSGELFRVAREVPGIDLLFGGHNLGDVAVTLNGLPVNKTGFSAFSIGHVRLEYDRRTQTAVCLKNEIVPVMRGSLPVQPDAGVAQAVEQALQPFVATLDEVLGQAEDDLVVAFDGEFALGNFFTDCMRDAAGAQIGLMNSTSCFGFIPKGPITAEMLMWVMCFNDHIYQGELSGAQLRQMLELTSTAGHQALNGGLQVSGLKAVLDSRRPEGQRVQSLALADGTPIADERFYRVATSAYLASGGNGYREILAPTRWQQTAHLTHPVFIAAMRARKVLRAELEGRIVDLAGAAPGAARSPALRGAGGRQTENEHRKKE